MRSRDPSPMRSRNTSPVRPRDVSPQRPMSGRDPSPFRGSFPQRDPSPRRQLPQPGQSHSPVHSPHNSFSQPTIPTSSFPPGTSSSAMEQAQKSLASRAFPAQQQSHAPTVTQSRPLPSSQYNAPMQYQQPPHHSFPSQPNSRPQPQPQRQSPTIREPSPTRPIRLPNLDDPAPAPVSPRMQMRGRSISPNVGSGLPRISLPEQQSVPQINIPTINVPDTSSIPSISFPEDNRVPTINLPGESVSVSEISVADSLPYVNGPSSPSTAKFDSRPTPSTSSSRGNGLTCAKCRVVIVGRMVSSGGSNGSLRWHPECFNCTVCGELLEHVSSYERDGKMYCHLDYHEKFAPSCAHCCTPIIDEEFISLDEPSLGGSRAYHAQHFFCAECGDPFLGPGQDLSSAEYIIHRGYAYCEACHVRLRMPLCRRVGCGKRIREWEGAVEALGGKWCNGCFRCKHCDQSLGESFFQRGKEAFCYDCYDIMLRNEV
ncbi:hypothetical protein BDZ89DRAFT_592848 [Hymenopellis radicata]|nr:hypothetical protein BDZ89DRAFT_592848 [Hymenopellis radicata]